VVVVSGRVVVGGCAVEPGAPACAVVFVDSLHALMISTIEAVTSGILAFIGTPLPASGGMSVRAPPERRPVAWTVASVSGTGVRGGRW
jgi:hypothetical protein